MDTQKIVQLLEKKIDTSKIKTEEPMSKHTTFKVGGNAEIFVKIDEIQDLEYVLQIIKQENIPMYVIGNGSNILVKDNGIRGIVLSIEFDNIEIKENEVIAGAGVKLIALSYKCAKCGLTGLEFASGIPGTIGGAVRMNAGAYGNEMSNVIVETVYMDMEGNIHTISNKEHDFSYRKSIFSKNKNIILQTKLKLEKGDENEIKSKMDELKKSRDEKQPLEFFSAGSTFKRGEDFITSKLIDEAGLKGYRVGDAEVSTKHAGFIINKGNAKAKDILDVIEYVKTKVKEKFGKDIELEIEIIGEN